MAQHVNRRCEVQYLGDKGKPWFVGTVESFCPDKLLHRVVFDDGDKLDIDLDSYLEHGILRWLVATFCS